MEPAGATDLPEPWKGELDKIDSLFAVGDFHQVRRLASALAVKADAPAEVVQRAKRLADGTKNDIVAYWILGGCLVLYALIVWQAFS